MSTLMNHEVTLLFTLMTIIVIWIVMVIAYVKLVRQASEQGQQLPFDDTSVVYIANSSHLK